LAARSGSLGETLGDRAFSGKNTGSATFFCPVLNVWLPQAKEVPPRFELVYMDPDGTGRKAQVTVANGDICDAKTIIALQSFALAKKRC